MFTCAYKGKCLECILKLWSNNSRLSVIEEKQSIALLSSNAYENQYEQNGNILCKVNSGIYILELTYSLLTTEPFIHPTFKMC